MVIPGLLFAQATAQAQPDLSRFSPAPPVGVHPRVIISPDDLPTIRKQLKEQAYGRRASKSINAWLGGAIGKYKPLHKTYRALVEGKANALELAANDWWASNISLSLTLEAFVALINEDSQRGKDVAAAITTYAQVYGGNLSPYGHKSVNPKASLALAYDFAFNFMTEEQRATVRKVLADTTNGRKSHGMDKPAHHATYNFYTHGTLLLTTVLAIEGEEGYDASIYPATVELMNNYLTYAIGPNGTPTEGMHYYNFGMANASMAMIAMAKRGDNLFKHANYFKTINWYVHSIEPYGYHFSQHGDTSNDGGGLLNNYVAMKCVFPKDPIVDFVWRNRIRDDYSGIQYRGCFLMFALYGSPWDQSPDAQRDPQATQWGVDSNVEPGMSDVPWNPAAFNLPTSFFGPDRGLLIARSKWDHDATVMHFEARTDTGGPSHAHANRGDFTLSALGRKWVIDRGFGISESFMHNIIQIDGKGQGFFCPAARILDQQNTDLYSSVTADISYPYTYRYTFGNRIGNKYQNDYKWEPETNTNVVKHVSTTQSADDEPWKTNTMYTHRALNNPVQYAFRTATLVRGEQPYAMIVDDIRKDDQPHHYEWLMQTPDDLDVETIKKDEVILKPTNGDDKSPRLWVKVIHATSPAGNLQDDTYQSIRYETFNLARSPSSGSTKDYGPGKRLVISSRSIDPAFKILILPYRPGEELPKVTNNADASIHIQWQNIIDTWTFKTANDHRTLCQMDRKAADMAK
jgi:hypothetical protein